MNDPWIRIVAGEPEADGSAGVTIYLNDTGRQLLLRRLEGLGPSDHHLHLEPYLAVDSERDATWADVVLRDD